MTQPETTLNLVGAPTAGSTESAAGRPSGLGLEPRVAVFALLAINVLVLSLRDQYAVYAAAGLVLIALASTKRWRIFSTVAAVMAVCFGIFWLLPQLENVAVAVTIATAGFWFGRFAVAIGAAIYLLLTVTPSDLVSSLHRLRAPRFLVVPMTVMLRYLPQARLEFVAIREAMALRGIPVGAWAWLRHPMRTVEYLLVPLLVSSSRLADDLTASGLVRGLGGEAYPTPLLVSRFTWRDALAVVVLLGLLGYAIWIQVSA